MCAARIRSGCTHFQAAWRVRRIPLSPLQRGRLHRRGHGSRDRGLPRGATGGSAECVCGARRRVARQRLEGGMDTSRRAAIQFNADRRHRGVVSRRRVCRRAGALATLTAAALLDACVKQPSLPSPEGPPITMGPVTTESLAEWDISAADAATIEKAVALETRIRIDSGLNNGVPFEVLQAPACAAITGVGGGWHCAARLTPVAVTRINRPGTHEVRIASYLAAPDPTTTPPNKVGESGGSTPAYVITTPGTPGPAPAAPVGSRMVRK